MSKKHNKDKEKQTVKTDENEAKAQNAKDGIKKDEQEPKKVRKKFSLKTKLAFVATLAVILVAAGFVGLYVYSPIGKATRPIFKKVPYPVAIIGMPGDVITSSELISNVDAVRGFYESQDYTGLGLRVDFTTEEGKNRLKVKEKDVLDKLVEDKIIEKLANQRGIVISTADAQESIDQKANQSDAKNSLELNLDSLYGWSIADFRDKVVVYQMYADELFEWYIKDTKNQQSYQKVAKALQELNEDGSNFAQIARDYSEGESAKNDGEMGWFKRNQLVSQVADVAFEMEENEISPIIASPLGFHIVQVLEVKNGQVQESQEDGGQKEIKVRQIFVKGMSFLEWVEQEKKKSKVYVLMKDYYWDQTEGRVRFSDHNLEKMEKKLRLQSDGDPSI